MGSRDRRLPVWVPEAGKLLIAAVSSVERRPSADKKSPDTVEYVLVAAHDVACDKDGAPVTVKAGERFSMKSYSTLPMTEYVNLGNVGICSVEMVDATWRWSVRLSAAQKARIERKREDREASRQSQDGPR